MSLRKHPWLAEHAVDGLVTFPGAAYLCMVLEAVRQLSANQAFESPSYMLRKVLFLRALILLPSSKNVEIYLSFQPLIIERLRQSYLFNIEAISNSGTWHKYCSGRVEIENNFLEAENRSWLISSLDLKSNQDKVFDETSLINPKIFYAQLKANDNYYGHNFFRICSLAWSDSTRIVAEVEVLKISTPRCLIHPNTFDAILQCSLPACQTQKSGSVMPTGIEQIIVEADIENRPLHRLSVTSSTETDSNGKTQSTILAFNGITRDLSGPCIWIEGLKLQGFQGSANPGRDE